MSASTTTRYRRTGAKAADSDGRNRSIRHRCFVGVLLCMLGCGLTACEFSPPRPVLEGESQVQLRSIQTRSFETDDKQQTLRTVIATLQDLGFVIDKADATLGAVSATKLDGYELRMTVTVRPRDTDSLLVRASAQYQMEPIDDPAPYQDFFTALEKSMFLAMHQVD